MESREVKVSVIIPVYNAERYLRQCLDSVCAQTLKEIEIICVDDGSKDSCGDILEEYAAKDSRVHVLHQQNQYAGVARNNGMKYANGAYLMFWDADDFFEPEALECMYKRSIEVDADVCLCGGNNYYTETNTCVHADALLNLKYVPESDIFNYEMLGDDFFRFTTLAIWNKMVRREFLLENDIEFQALKNANDVYFTTVVLYLAKRITVVDKYLVNYRKLDEASLTFSASKSAFSIIDAWTSAYERIKKEFPDCQRSFANRALASIIGALHMTSDYAEFCKLSERLKNGALERIGIVPPQGDYYYNERNSNWLKKCLTLSPQEFHAYFTITTFRSQLEQIQVYRDKLNNVRNKLRVKEKRLEKCTEKILVKDDKIQREEEKLKKQEDRIQKQSDKLQKQNKKIQKQSSKLQRQDEKIQKQSSMLQIQSDKLEKQAERINDLDAQLTALKNSKSYRIGRIITWLPRKIFGIYPADASSEE